MKHDINKEQRTGVRIFIDPNAPVDVEGMKRFQDSLLERDANEMSRQIDSTNRHRKDWIDKELKPCNANVIILPYNERPYTPKIEVNKSGLIVGGINDQSLMKNPDTGEMDSMKKGIWCCKVIAVGPKCENVEVGDDIYCRFDIAVPIPFGGLGYYSMCEANIITCVRNKE